MIGYGLKGRCFIPVKDRFFFLFAISFGQALKSDGLLFALGITCE
jgi:hypothetical protein